MPAAKSSALRRRPKATQSSDEDVVFDTTPGLEAVPSFDQMGFRDEVLRGIYHHGYEKPSAIQQRAIVPILQGRDVIAQAQSGTGKTSMIALVACQLCKYLSFHLPENLQHRQRVILSVGDKINVQARACIGGKSVGEDIKKLEHGVHVVSGTPGRVIDMIKRRSLRSKAIKLLVLDESDEMLSRGFKEHMYDVYRYLPPEVQGMAINFFKDEDTKTLEDIENYFSIEIDEMPKNVAELI